MKKTKAVTVTTASLVLSVLVGEVWLWGSTHGWRVSDFVMTNLMVWTIVLWSAAFMLITGLLIYWDELK